MSIEEIIARLEEMADDREDKILPGCLGWDEIEPLREAIALLKTHPDNQPNEPLKTAEALREMDGCPAWDTRLQVWGLVDVGLGILITRKGDVELNVAAATKVLYRRPPKDEE